LKIFSAVSVCLLCSAFGRASSPPFLQYSSQSENPEVFVQALAKARSVPTLDTVASNEKLCGGIVNHHLLAGELIGQFFLELAKRQTPETFIIIGPNHQSRGPYPIVLSKADWKTPFELVRPDTDLIRLIQTETGQTGIDIPIDERAFFNEHSIGALVPFIKKLFPRAKIVPIILKPRLPPEVRTQLVLLLCRILARRNCFFVLSMDFSHKKPAARAAAEDTNSIAAIKHFDTDHNHLQTLDVDCPNGLEIITATMKQLSAHTITVLQHKHSAAMLGRPEEPGTSYFTLFWGKNRTKR
jgi:AmmeMemoRadiSam system protein B